MNPLLRAAYLTRGREAGKVSLMLPWVGLEDQQYVLPEGCRYETREGQEAYIRDWLRGSGMAEEAELLDIAWYDARYHQVAGCIFPMGDITRLIPDGEADVCIMEEPEHLNWFRATGVNWSKKFTHVVGVIHTNYVHYTMADTNHWASGRVKAPFARAFNKVMARAYCDKVIKLSATLQKFAEEKETVTNVHGVRENFLIVGDERAELTAKGEPFPEGNRCVCLCFRCFFWGGYTAVCVILCGSVCVFCGCVLEAVHVLLVLGVFWCFFMFFFCVFCVCWVFFFCVFGVCGCVLGVFVTRFSSWGTRGWSRRRGWSPCGRRVFWACFWACLVPLCCRFCICVFMLFISLACVCVHMRCVSRLYVRVCVDVFVRLCLLTCILVRVCVLGDT